MYYECHITIKSKRPDLTAQLVECYGWTFSQIDGDPVLGKGVKCYATKHYNAKYTVDEVKEELTMAHAALIDPIHKIVRRKVELVLIDERYKDGRKA